MPKIKVTSSGSIVDMMEEATTHPLSISVSCDTHDFTSNCFKAKCSLAIDPNAEVSPSNNVNRGTDEITGKTFPSSCTLVFQTTNPVPLGTSYTLTLVNSNPNETWSFGNDTATFTGTFPN
ncbi:MAG: hypothetical protein R3A50_07735 [Saprospiraceae bacterium]|nr:hypothetical protein [Saprospiraceae bacterium]MCB9345306.1 hypothetical protein [Lewinellaceae bacterium]